MGLFNIGRKENISIKRNIIEEEPLTTSEKIDKIAKQFQTKKDLKRKEILDAGRKIAIAKRKKASLISKKRGFLLGKQIAGIGISVPKEDFSFQEQVLRQTVGGRGDKIWGTNLQPVTIFNDLNPRQRGDTGTAEMFGF